MSFMAALILLTPARFTLRQAQVPLDPPENLPLGGYTARQGKASEPGGEILHARVAILSQGHKSVAFVSLEMLTVPESLVVRVREKLPSDVALFMVATHTHSAPDSQMLNSRMLMGVPGIATYKEKWLTWYVDRISTAINTAHAARATPVDLATAEFDPRLNRSRRPYGAPDPLAHVVEAGDRPLLSIYAAHGTIYDEHRNQTSGDWPGEMMRENGGLVLPGAIGDVSPASGNDKATGAEKIRLFAQIWQRAFHMAEPVSLSGGLNLASERIDLGEPFLHPDFARANGVPEVLAKRLLTTFAPREANITAVRIGDVVLLGVPGEPTSHVGRRIAEYGRRKGLRVWPISHCNGWMGYIVDPADYLLNGYEATLTMYGPGTANRVVDAAERAIDKLGS